MVKKQKIVTRTRSTVNDGDLVERDTRSVDTEDSQVTAANIVYFILSIVELLLALRFVFKLFGANTASGFVNFIYAVTNPLTAPFDYIFNTTSTTHGNVFEPSILVAAFVYAVIAWGIVRLITINRDDV